MLERKQPRRGLCASYLSRDHMSEYAEMMADIARNPRPTLWQRFTIALAGQR